MNFFISSIVLKSLNKNSPFFQKELIISNSLLLNFFNSFLFIKKKTFFILFKNFNFKNFLNSVININSFYNYKCNLNLNSTIILYNIKFEYCLSNNNGAGLNLINSNSNLNLSKSTFYKCFSSVNGGGIWININNSFIIECCFINCFCNSFRNAGGGYIKNFGYLNSTLLFMCSPNKSIGGGGSF